jgi:hypothetical protein
MLLSSNSCTRPHRAEVEVGNLFNACPLNFLAMSNASSGEWAKMCYMRSQQEGTAAAVKETAN